MSQGDGSFRGLPKAKGANGTVLQMGTEAERLSTRERFQKILPDLEYNALSRIISYYDELLRFNKAVNLISPSTIGNAESVHFADSVFASQIIVKHLVPSQPLYDVGSGNGFPGLIFAILFPTLPVVLVDRDRRKTEFLKHVTAILGLKNVNIEAVSVENLRDQSVSNMVSRGFAPLHRALLVCRKQVLQGGKYFHLKGDAWANEIAQVPSQLFSLWSPSLLGQYTIPGLSAQFAVVVTDKIAN